MIRRLLLLTLPTLALGLSSCGTSTSSSPVATYQAYNRPATLPSNPANVRVKVSLSKQMVYVMEGSNPLLVTPVSVGAPGTPTPKGRFRIFKKEAKHRANSHGWATNGTRSVQTRIHKKPSGWTFKGTPMPYWCEFKSHYGFHTGWMKNSPCTHGCIRMHENVAPKFYRLVSVGTPVHIAHSQPEDTTLGRSVPRPPDAGPLPDYPASMYLEGGYFSRHLAPTFQ